MYYTTAGGGGGGSTATTTSYVHDDHLGSVNVLSTEAGLPRQALDYLPYGSERIDVGTSTTQKTYIGEYYDDETDLSYLHARYYQGSRGQFLSQDPVFWEIGQTKDGKSVLTNPQAQNSYSYSQNNPIVNKDPTGRQYTNFSGGYAFPICFCGPIGGFYDTPNDDSSDPFIYIGFGGSSRPGPSGSVTYSPSGSPTEGTSVSVSGFHRGIGGQLSVGKGPTGNTEITPEYGIGTQGFSGGVVYTARVSSWLYHLGGPLEYVTTPATLRPTIFGTQTSNSSNPALFSSPTNNVSVSTGSARSSAFNSATASISAASAAISRGDYAGASKHLQNASKALK